MQPVVTVRTAPFWLAALALCALAAPAAAQAPAPAQPPPVEQGSTDWRAANDAVAQFKRGHADVLKWEAANPQAPAVQLDGTATAAPETWLRSADAAVRQAWRAQPELAPALARLGAQGQEQLAQGRWLALEPDLQRRVEGFDSLLEVAAQARATWLAALTASLALEQQRAMQEAAEAAAELARRMARVGNWSRMEQAQWQAKLGRMQRQTLQAESEVRQTQAALLKATRLWGLVPRVGLADALPALPEALPGAAVQQRLVALRAVLPRAQGQLVATHAQLAFDNYSASQRASQIASDEVRLQQFIHDEVVLRYNGMLLSVWDLLTQSAELSQARIELLHAQRDVLLADAALQRVLQSGEGADHP